MIFAREVAKLGAGDLVGEAREDERKDGGARG
jgi:hypothetical protein